MVAKSGAKPKRTMLFCAFAGEEFGLLGAFAWVKANKDNNTLIKLYYQFLI